MKKTLIFGSLLIAFAMMSNGGNTLLAHAQSAPTDTATLQQELDDAKAQLVQLQMEEGQVPAGDSSMTVTPAPAASMTMTLSATDISEVKGTLTALAGVLTDLQMKITQDPQFATTDGASVVSGLQGIGNTLAAIVADAESANVAMATPQTSASQMSGSQGVAQANPTTGNTPAAASAPVAPSAPVAAATQPAATVTPTPAAAPTPAPVAANTIPQTTQAAASFSLGKLNWPLIIVIILIVAAIAIWLWWDDSDDKQTVVVKTTSSTPQRPLQQGNQEPNSNRPVSGPQTPLSSAVSPQGNR